MEWKVNEYGVPVRCVCEDENAEQKDSFEIVILGNRWTVRVYPNEADDTRLDGAEGFMDWTNKEIGIKDGREDSDLKHPMMYLMKNLRHEITHAFLWESGMGGVMWCERDQEETIVDWIAVQVHGLDFVCRDAESKLADLLG